MTYFDAMLHEHFRAFQARHLAELDQWAVKQHALIRQQAMSLRRGIGQSVRQARNRIINKETP